MLERYKLLRSYSGPEDLKNLSYRDLEELAREVRDYIIQTTSRNGGHVGPSLGVVELTIALLRIFNPPEDTIVWDIGHQAYAWKILTDRKETFPTLRKYKGISGFLRRERCLRGGSQLHIHFRSSGLQGGEGSQGRGGICRSRHRRRCHDSGHGF